MVFKEFVTLDLGKPLTINQDDKKIKSKTPKCTSWAKIKKPKCSTWAKVYCIITETFFFLSYLRFVQNKFSIFNGILHKEILKQILFLKMISVSARARANKNE